MLPFPGKEAGRASILTTLTAPAVKVGGLTVTPVARSLTIRCPAGYLLWVWPSSVLVSGEGSTRRIRIVNVTRLIQAFIGVMALLFTLVLFLGRIKRKERQS